LINGVLVERTVADVVPALKTNAEGIKKVLEDLVKTYKVKQDELDKWKVGRVAFLRRSVANAVHRKRTTSRLCRRRDVGLPPPDNSLDARLVRVAQGHEMPAEYRTTLGRVRRVQQNRRRRPRL
jgi:hypothetical protein